MINVSKKEYFNTKFLLYKIMLPNYLLYILANKKAFIIVSDFLAFDIRKTDNNCMIISSFNNEKEILQTKVLDVSYKLHKMGIRRGMNCEDALEILCSK